MSAITVPTRTLRMMLAMVLPHAGADDPLPLLSAVRFEVRAGMLYLIATDRYSIGVARHPVPGATIAPVPDRDALLALDDAQALYGRLKGHDTAAIVLAGDKVTVDYGAALDSWANIPLNGVTWPDWRGLLYPMLTAEAAKGARLDEGFGVDMRLLARFSIDPGRYAAWEDDEDYVKPEWEPEAARVRIVRPDAPTVLIARGNWFLGAAMPVRLDRSDAATAPPWDDWTAICAPAEQAAA